MPRSCAFFSAAAASVDPRLPFVDPADLNGVPSKSRCSPAGKLKLDTQDIVINFIDRSEGGIHEGVWL